MMNKVLTVVLSFLLLCCQDIYGQLGGNTVVGGKLVIGGGGVTSFITLNHTTLASKECNSGATCALAYAANVKVGELLLVGVRVSGGTNVTSLTVADSVGGGNSWTAGTVSNGSTTLRTQLFWANNATAGADTVTASVSPNESFFMFVTSYSNVVSSSPMDVQNVGTATSASASVGSITPTQANELCFQIVGANANSTFTAGESYVIQSQGGNGGNNTTEIADWIQTTATATTGTMTISPSSRWAEAVACFKKQ